MEALLPGVSGGASMKILYIIFAGHWIASAILHAMGVWEPDASIMVVVSIFMALCFILLAMD